MYGNESDNLQLLGGALIVLSLALLYCWYKNSNNQYSLFEGMTTYADKQRSRFEGMSGQKARTTASGGSMHDQEGLTVNRNPPSEQQRRANVTGLRWAVEGMHTPDQSAMFDRDNYEAYRIMLSRDPTGTKWSMEDINEFYENTGGNRPVSGDVLTPFKPLPLSNCNSHSGDQMTMTESGMNYGLSGDTWSQSRNTSGVTI